MNRSLALVLLLAVWPTRGANGAPDEAAFARLRENMVRRHLVRRDITDARVLDAMGKVRRHHYVPDEQRRNAYDDRPLPIGHAQTISQPYIVAFMTQAARLKGHEILPKKRVSRPRLLSSVAAKTHNFLWYTDIRLGILRPPSSHGL